MKPKRAAGPSPGTAPPGLMMAGQKGYCMRYYSTQRPIGPGTIPQPKGNKVLEIHNYDQKTYCEE